MTLGWNFGDGHLHHEPLLRKIQDALNFEEGELIVLMVEPQALGGKDIDFRLVDAARGERFRGKVQVSDLEGLQPWEKLSDDQLQIVQSPQTC